MFANGIASIRKTGYFPQIKFVISFSDFKSFTVGLLEYFLEPLACVDVVVQDDMSLVYEKTIFFCICENKDADQLRGNGEADQRLCFCYMDSTISLLSESEFSSL